MNKRRLTEQQRLRIRATQEAKRTRRSHTHDVMVDSDSAPREGLVVGHYGKRVDVETESADSAGVRQRHACHFRANLESGLVAGDRVIWRECTDGSGVIEAVLERRSLLARPDSRGLLRPVAANIDFIVLVIACEPAPSATLIDRYLAAAELQGIEVRLLLNKLDLADDDYRSVLDALLEPYRDAGYEVHGCSSLSGEGMEALDAMLAGTTSVFVGQSGVGKSSLVNTLLGEEQARVGELSEHSRLGRHTTTNAMLFHFPRGGSVIDSPGIREFGLWHLDPASLIKGFREFAPYLGQCRFSDCGHRTEPDCAIKAAVAEGALSEERLESYFALFDSLAAN